MSGFFCSGMGVGGLVGAGSLDAWFFPQLWEGSCRLEERA